MKGVNFTAGDWQRIEETYNAWWNHELDRPLIYFTNVYRGGRAPEVPGHSGFLSNYGLDRPVSEIIDNWIKLQEGREFPGDSFPFLFANFGAGVLAVPLGARMNSTSETVWFDPPEGADLGELTISFDTDSPWWRRIVAVVTAAVERMGDVVQVGHTDLGGNLDILASLIGSEALMIELIDRPVEVEKAAEAITKVWLRAFDELDAIVASRCPGRVAWAPTWSKGSTYMLQSDASYMISPDMFERFVMGDLTACCEHIEYPFYHLDGIGEIPHLDHLLSIENLRGIQWIPGDGKPQAEDWPELLKRILDAGRLVQVFTDVKGTLKICRELGGRGIQMMVRDELKPGEAAEVLDEIERLSH